MIINRTYNHREFGEIGKVTLTIPDGDWNLGGTVLPESSVEHLATFALQTLQDAYAGAKDETEAKANWVKKLTRLMEGTLGTRGGEGLNDIRSVATLRLFKAAMDKDTVKRFNKLSASDQVRKALANADAFAAEAIAAEVATIEAERAAKAEAEAKRKATVAELAGKIKFDF